MTNQSPTHPPVTDDGDFSHLGMSELMLMKLRDVGYTKPTPIQQQAIPIAITGKDIIGIAQTGTGKTLAFGVPLIEQIVAKQAYGLIVVPTRELALQVEESLIKISRGLKIGTVSLIGGASMGNQLRLLRTNPQIIIGTPGRIIDHMERRSLDMRKFSVLVLDEADRMLDLGFAQQIRRILELVPKVRQTMLFSATMPADIVRIAERHMHLPLRVEIAPAGTTADRVEQELFIIPREQKHQLLDRLLHEYSGPILIFTRTKHGAKKLTHTVQNFGHKAAEIHSNRTLAQRRQALDGFKSGQYRVLVATDIAARGIDVTGIELVLNYDIPENPDDYVHRIGRTARAGQTGKAITFVQPDQRHKIRDIERLVRSTLAVSALPELPPTRDLAHPPRIVAAPQGHQRRAFGHHQPQRRPDRAPDTQPAVAAVKPAPIIPRSNIQDDPSWLRPRNPQSHEEFRRQNRD